MNGKSQRDMKRKIYEKRNRKKGQRYLQSMKKKGRERERTRHTHTYQKPWVPTNLLLQNQTSEDRPLLLLLLYFFGCVFCFFFLDEVDVKWYDNDCGCWEICLFIGFDFFGLYSFTLFFLINIIIIIVIILILILITIIIMLCIIMILIGICLINSQ